MHKLLRFGHYYLNEQGDFVVGLVSGNKLHGYTFIASHAHPNVMLGKIHSQSRVVPNDGHWIEIDSDMFTAVFAIHASGHKVKFFPDNRRKLPIISKF